MLGVDLLLARLTTWQDFSASERESTSLAALLPPLAALAARWRRLQLAGWRQLLDKALAAEAARACELWHTSYLLLFADGQPPPALASVLPAFEDFLTSASLGQFSTRLELLQTFAGHCQLWAAKQSRDAPWAAQAWQLLSVALANLAAYFGQHTDGVQAALQDALSGTRKELQVRAACGACTPCL